MELNALQIFSISLIFLVIGFAVGWVVAKILFEKQFKKVKKQMEELDKDQVRNMLSAFGQKPSEEQVNRIVSMTENVKKKKMKKAKKK